MKLVGSGPRLTAVTLLLATCAWSHAASPAAAGNHSAVSDTPYMTIVARNTFGLWPIPVVVPPTTEPDPPPKITVNGAMTIFGKKQALFKVADNAKPGQQAKEKSYLLAEGEREDDITVVEINNRAGIITFNNHGVMQELALVPALGKEK